MEFVLGFLFLPNIIVFRGGGGGSTQMADPDTAI